MALPFEKFQAKAWPFWYQGELTVKDICGGVPAAENVAEGWIKTKLKNTRSELNVQELVAKTKADIRQTNIVAGRLPAEGDTLVMDDMTGAQAELLNDISDDELTEAAVAKAAKDLSGLNMFKRTREGVLHIEGRQLKAALREAVSVAANAGKIKTAGWGKPDNAAYKKQIKGWFPEHVFVVDDILPLYREDGSPVTEPDETLQKFVHTHRGDAIGFEEVVRGGVIRFKIKTDVELTPEEWAMIWLTGEMEGLGASRSQGYGTYTVTSWEKTRG